MKRPVLAIGLDAAPLDLILRWSAQGRLPVLARVLTRGARAPLASLETYQAELPWTTFFTGVTPERTGWWTPIAFDPATYRVRDAGAYDYREHPPFYARGAGLRAVVFDGPQSALVPGLPGVQIRGWGTHSPMTPSDSEPEGLLAELARRHGEHPMFGREHTEPWDVEKCRWLRTALIEGARRRAAIACELLARERFDLFIAVFSETHVAGHCLWHLSQPDHPLWRERTEPDPLLEVFQAVDAALGALWAAAPEDACLVVFSLNGMQANSHDLPSMVYLPELLYRMTGRVGLAAGRERTPRWKLARAQSLPFMDEVWARKHDWNPLRRRARRRGIRASRRVERFLGSGAGLAHPESFPELRFQPPLWYASCWPSMPAFALPSLGQGHVRVNLRGRERDGIVEPADYDAVLARIAGQVARMHDPRTGKPLARRVWRSRRRALECDAKRPEADLVVVWEDGTADTADCGELGRIGPIPYHRSGGHVPEGFVAVAGPGIAPGVHPPHDVLDLAPTLLELAGAPIPSALDGAAIAFAG